MRYKCLGCSVEWTKENMTPICAACYYKARADEFRKERDLAVLHDRQPYPTAWAYEKACEALEKAKKEIAAQVEQIGEWKAVTVALQSERDEWKDCAARRQERWAKRCAELRGSAVKKVCPKCEDTDYECEMCLGVGAALTPRPDGQEKIR